MAKQTLTVETAGLEETLKAFSGLERDLRSNANAELRDAAGEASSGLVLALRQAAASGPPVARRVAASAKVKRDRVPAVQIGGRAKVGRAGAIAAVLVWGSERGPASGASVNRFGVGRNEAGYWIAPTVERFGSSRALETYKRAVYSIMRKWGLV